MTTGESILAGVLGLAAIGGGALAFTASQKSAATAAQAAAELQRQRAEASAAAAAAAAAAQQRATQVQQQQQAPDLLGGLTKLFQAAGPTVSALGPIFGNLG